jgi:hypothetical protein
MIPELTLMVNGQSEVFDWVILEAKLALGGIAA